jgi:hypothetical protein
LYRSLPLVDHTLWGVQAAVPLVPHQTPSQRGQRQHLGDLGDLRPHAGRITEANRRRSPVTSSTRLSLTRGARSSTAPDEVNTCRGTAWPLRQPGTVGRQFARALRVRQPGEVHIDYADLDPDAGLSVSLGSLPRNVRAHTQRQPLTALYQRLNPVDEFYHCRFTREQVHVLVRLVLP